MKRKILFLLLALLGTQAATAQTSQPVTLPAFPYKSPEALSFQRYGEYRVGEYTGNPQIGLPLYTLSYRDIELPIALTYQGGGIRVADEASWVGLGWNLAVGGCINYIPAGDVDSKLSRSAAWSEYFALLNSNPGTTFGTFETVYQPTDNLMNDLKNGLGERDFYSVTLPDKSFLFFTDPYTNAPVLIGRESGAYKIESQGNGQVWVITDGDGMRYTFANREITSYGGGQTYTSAWYLTQITSPRQATVTLNYTSPGLVYFLPKLYEQYDAIVEAIPLGSSSLAVSAAYPTPGYSRQFYYSGYSTSKCYLSSIVTDDQTVTFNLSSRLDIQGASRKLDGFTVKSAATNGVVKQVAFAYDYFTASTVGGDYLTGTANDYRTKRLKLLSVSDGITDAGRQVHSFEYDETRPLPYKTSYATDFWGYYNGSQNYMPSGSDITATRTFIPTPSSCFIGDDSFASFPDAVKTKTAANRFTNSNYVTTGMLKKIVYPTKGYTTFNFEPHEFLSTPIYAEGSGSTSQTYQVDDVNFVGTGGPTIQRMVPVTAACTGTLQVTFRGKSGASLQEMKNYGASVMLIPTVPPQTTSYTVNLNNVSGNLSTQYTYTTTIPVTLDANTYSFVANLPAQFGDNPNMSVNAKLTLNQNSATFSTGGGVRIAAIANYGADGTLLEQTTYEYVTESGATSGKLICPVGITEEVDACVVVGDEVSNSDAARYRTLRLLGSGGSGVPAFTSTLSNGTVGYSRVVQKKSGNGSIASTYRNQPASSPVANLYLFDIALDNGDLLSQIHRNAAGTLLKKIENTYTLLGTQRYKCNATVTDRYPLQTTLFSPEDVQMSDFPRYFMRVYGYFSSRKPLTRSVVTEYVNGTAAATLTHDYTYDSTNLQLRRDKQSSSQSGKTFITEYDYPTSFPTEGYYANLVDFHILNPVVGSSLYSVSGTTETLLGKEKTLYSQFNGLMFLPATEQHAPAGSTLENRITYTYDAKGNVRSLVKDGTEKVVYLWAYNSLYPVAKIEGATYAQVEGWLGASTISSLAANSTTVETALNGIRSDLSGKGVLVTTYTYSPLVGMTGTTLPDGEKITYTYDADFRLSTVKDHNGKTVEQYDYHYKN